MKKLLVIGIGSQIMMDDGIGIYLVEDLKHQLKDPNISFITGETDVDYCLSKISDFQRVVIIDAYESGKNPGAVTVVPLCHLAKVNNSSYSLHGIHLINTLEFMKHKPEGILVGIEPYEINYGFSLSTVLHNQYQQILKSIVESINTFI